MIPGGHGEGRRVLFGGEGSKAKWGRSQGRLGLVRGCFEVRIQNKMGKVPGTFGVGRRVLWGRSRGIPGTVWGTFGEGPKKESGPSPVKMALRPREGIINGDGHDSFFGPSPEHLGSFPGSYRDLHRPKWL